MKVKFNFVSTATTDSVDSYYWDFGNGETSSLMDPDTVIYESGNKYSITLGLSFSGGYDTLIVRPNLITVHHTVPANFDYSVSTASEYFYTMDQVGTLDTGVTYTFDWNIEAIGSRTGQHQEVIFPSVDTFTVVFTLSDEFGCTSTITKDIVLLASVKIPNVFTPGGSDATNNFFVINNSGGIPLRIRIYSRTGILVYEAEGTVIEWNGETASGDKMNTGVYYYVLEAISGDPGKKFSKSGFLHLYRKD